MWGGSVRLYVRAPRSPASVCVCVYLSRGGCVGEGGSGGSGGGGGGGDGEGGGAGVPMQEADELPNMPPTSLLVDPLAVAARLSLYITG